VLAEGLSAPGEIGLGEATELVFADWDRQVAGGNVTQIGVGNYRRLLTPFQAWAAAHGIERLGDVTSDHVVLWINSLNHNRETPSDSLQNTRRTAIRALFVTARVLGLIEDSPAALVHTKPDSAREASPLSAAQVAQLKANSRPQMGEVKLPSMLALSLLGASGQEVAFVRGCDVDLDAGAVWLHHGSARSFPRWVPIDDDWAGQALRFKLTALQKTTDDWRRRLLCYEPRLPDPTPYNRQSAVSNALTDLMRDARVFQPGRYSANSIRQYTAVRVYNETGRIEAAAYRLGMRSLDRMADLLGLDWRIPYQRDDLTVPDVDGESW
jgi:integrase/recombinase XerC